MFNDMSQRRDYRVELDSAPPQHLKMAPLECSLSDRDLTTRLRRKTQHLLYTTASELLSRNTASVPACLTRNQKDRLEALKQNTIPCYTIARAGFVSTTCIQTTALHAGRGISDAVKNDVYQASRRSSAADIPAITHRPSLRSAAARTHYTLNPNTLWKIAAKSTQGTSL
jgi:hypothetical protein